MLRQIVATAGAAGTRRRPARGLPAWTYRNPELRREFLELAR